MERRWSLRKSKEKDDEVDSTACQLPKRKLVLIGDAKVGKSCLLYSFMHQTFNNMEYLPTVFENCVTDIFLEKYSKKIELALWDTAGHEDHETLRPLSYGETDVIVLCYSVVDPTSFLNIPVKWCPEIKHFCEKYVPVILVGLQIDLRNDPSVQENLAKENKAPVPTSEGEAMASKIDACAFMECSAKNGQNVSEIFLEAALAAYKEVTNLLDGPHDGETEKNLCDKLLKYSGKQKTSLYKL